MPLYLRPTILLSAIIGAGLGIITLIPFLNMFIFIPFSIVGGVIIYLLKKNHVVGVLSINEGTIIGSLAGYISFNTAMVVFIPISLVLGLIFKNSYLTSTLVAGASFMITSFNILVTIMLVQFVALIFALFSAFSGLVASFIYQKIEDAQIEKEFPEFTIEK